MHGLTSRAWCFKQTLPTLPTFQICLKHWTQQELLQNQMWRSLSPQSIYSWVADLILYNIRMETIMRGLTSPTSTADSLAQWRSLSPQRSFSPQRSIFLSSWFNPPYLLPGLNIRMETIMRGLTSPNEYYRIISSVEKAKSTEKHLLK